MRRLLLVILMSVSTTNAQAEAPLKPPIGSTYTASQLAQRFVQKAFDLKKMPDLPKSTINKDGIAFVRIHVRKFDCNIKMIRGEDRLYDSGWIIKSLVCE